jgi:hypothetical protein
MNRKKNRHKYLIKIKPNAPNLNAYIKNIKRENLYEQRLVAHRHIRIGSLNYSTENFKTLSFYPTLLSLEIRMKRLKNCKTSS